MKNIFIALVLLLSVQGFAKDSKVADFSGVWFGYGTLVSPKNPQGLQCDFKLDIRQSADKIEFGKFVYGCNDYAFGFFPPMLTIKNKKEVYWKDQKIGELEASSTKLVFKLENGGTPTYTAELKDEKTMIYEDAQLFPENYQIMNAVLTKQN